MVLGGPLGLEWTLRLRWCLTSEQIRPHGNRLVNLLRLDYNQAADTSDHRGHISIRL